MKKRYPFDKEGTEGVMVPAGGGRVTSKAMDASRKGSTAREHGGREDGMDYSVGPRMTPGERAAQQAKDLQERLRFMVEGPGGKAMNAVRRKK
jgi:hypothetical protein